MRRCNNLERPNEMARALGVTGLELRNWLRIELAAGHALLDGHWPVARADKRRNSTPGLLVGSSLIGRTALIPCWIGCGRAHLARGTRRAVTLNRRGRAYYRRLVSIGVL